MAIIAEFNDLFAELGPILKYGVTYCKQEYDDGSVFKGQVRNKMFNGYGKMMHASKDLYKGHWKDGAMHGNGMYAYSDGAVYQGQFRENLRDGYGVFKFTDGSLYEGDWKDDHPEGKGRVIYKSGDIIDTTFTGGQQDLGRNWKPRNDSLALENQQTAPVPALADQLAATLNFGEDAGATTMATLPPLPPLLTGAPVGVPPPPPLQEPPAGGLGVSSSVGSLGMRPPPNLRRLAPPPPPIRADSFMSGATGGMGSRTPVEQPSRPPPSDPPPQPPQPQPPPPTSGTPLFSASNGSRRSVSPMRTPVDFSAYQAQAARQSGGAVSPLRLPVMPSMVPPPPR